MAYVVARPRGRFEIRESVHTPKGSRARSLASFTELSDEVLGKAGQRASQPFDADAVRASAARAGVPPRRHRQAEMQEPEMPKPETRKAETWETRSRRSIRASPGSRDGDEPAPPGRVSSAAAIRREDSTNFRISACRTPDWRLSARRV